MKTVECLCPCGRFGRFISRTASAVLRPSALILLMGLSLLRAEAQMPRLTARGPHAAVPQIAALAQWKASQPLPVDQILVQLRPGIQPTLFARAFSAAIATIGPNAALAAAGVGSARPPAAPALTYMRSNPDLGWHLFKLPSAADLPGTLAALRSRPEVVYAEPDYRVRMETTPPPPNDSYWGQVDLEHLIVVLSGLDDTSTARDDDADTWTYTWSEETIDCLDAWNVYPGHFYTTAERKNLLATDPARLPLVGVIDSGIDFTHPDFNASGSGTGDSTINDVVNGGQINVSLARNLVNGNTNPNPLLAADDFGHGTSVSGIIAAAPNNGLGIPGVGFPAQIVPIKVIDANGNGSNSDVTDGITYAVNHHCLILNMSLAIDTTAGQFPQFLQQAIDYAWNHGTLIIAAAGNDSTASGSAAGLTRRYPADCVHALAVSATDYANAFTIPSGPTGPYTGENLASYSNFGDAIGVAAPGGDVTTFSNPAPNAADFGLDPLQEYVLIWTLAPTYQVLLSNPDPANPDGEYAQFGLYGLNYGALPGTSLAAPHVVGVAALYASQHRITQATPNAPQLLVNAVERGAIPMNGRSDGGWDPNFGWGRIDAYGTVLDLNVRLATVGGFIGQVTYLGSLTPPLTVTAQRIGTANRYFASILSDGIYHMENLPVGTYLVTATFEQHTARRIVTVAPGCDILGVNLPIR